MLDFRNAGRPLLDAIGQDQAHGGPTETAKLGAAMIRVLENLIDRVAQLPTAAQEEIVRAVVEIEQRHGGAYQLTEEEHADILEALEEVRRDEVASDDEAAAVFKRLTA